MMASIRIKGSAAAAVAAVAAVHHTHQSTGRNHESASAGESVTHQCECISRFSTSM